MLGDGARGLAVMRGEKAGVAIGEKDGEDRLVLATTLALMAEGKGGKDHRPLRRERSALMSSMARRVRWGTIAVDSTRSPSPASLNSALKREARCNTLLCRVSDWCGNVLAVCRERSVIERCREDGMRMGERMGCCYAAAGHPRQHC